MEDKDQDPRKVQRAVIRDGTKDLLAGGGMPIRRMSGSDRPPPASRGHLCPESRGGSPEGGGTAARVGATVLVRAPDARPVWAPDVRVPFSSPFFVFRFPTRGNAKED